MALLPRRPKRPTEALIELQADNARLRAEIEVAQAEIRSARDALGASLELHQRIGGYLPAKDQIMLRIAGRQRVGDALTEDERQVLRNAAAKFAESWR